MTTHKGQASGQSIRGRANVVNQNVMNRLRGFKVHAAANGLPGHGTKSSKTMTNVRPKADGPFQGHADLGLNRLAAIEGTPMEAEATRGGELMAMLFTSSEVPPIHSSV